MAMIGNNEALQSTKTKTVVFVPTELRKKEHQKKNRKLNTFFLPAAIFC